MKTYYYPIFIFNIHSMYCFHEVASHNNLQNPKFTSINTPYTITPPQFTKDKTTTTLSYVFSTATR